MKKLLSAAMLLGAAAAYGCYQNNSIEITRYTVAADVERPLRLLCLSDLHGKQFGERNKGLIEKVKSLSPDLIVFPGDTLSADCRNFRKTAAALKALCSIAPCFLIAGNHEHRSGRWREISQKFKSAGVTVLENECWSGEINGVAINILGLDEGKAASRLDYLRAALGTLKHADNREALRKLCMLNGAKIVLSHFPENFAQIGKYSYSRFGFDLMLSGHAHGGHFRFSNKYAFFAAGQGFLPKFCQGLYGNRPKLLVSRGLGNDSPLPRINNRPEMALITLKRGADHYEI